MENRTHDFREANLAFQLAKESRIKSKTDELELAKEKVSSFLVPFILSKTIFYCVLSQCTVY